MAKKARTIRVPILEPDANGLLQIVGYKKVSAPLKTKECVRYAAKKED